MGKITDSGIIRCAYCESGYLHHYETMVYNRTKEDCTGILTIVEKDRLVVENDDDMESNPSPRRDGIRIMCECENCEELTEIHIFQHKGCTYIDVVKNDDSITVDLLCEEPEDQE